MIGCSHNESCSEMDILMFTGKSIYPWAIIYMDEADTVKGIVNCLSLLLQCQIRYMYTKFLSNLVYTSVPRLLIVACGVLVHCSSMAGYWQDLEHAVDPEHPKHVQCVTRPVSMQAMQELMFSGIQELCTEPFNMGSCIIMVQHEVMFVDE